MLGLSSGHAELLKEASAGKQTANMSRLRGTPQKRVPITTKLRTSAIAMGKRGLWRAGTRFSPVHIVIEISERVEVPAAPRIVWDVLSDPRAVVDYVPGVKLGDRLEDGSYDATVTVKFGPAKVTSAVVLAAFAKVDRNHARAKIPESL